MSSPLLYPLLRIYRMSSPLLYSSLRIYRMSSPLLYSLLRIYRMSSPLLYSSQLVYQMSYLLYFFYWIYRKSLYPFSPSSQNHFSFLLSLPKLFLLIRQYHQRPYVQLHLQNQQSSPRPFLSLPKASLYGPSSHLL